MSLLETHDGLLFDLDGVLYEGSRAVPGAVEAILELQQRGIALACVTNNASRSPQAVAEQLQTLGMAFQPEQIISSPTAAVALMQAKAPEQSSVLVIGSDYLRDEVKAAGFVIADSAADRPAAVIQGFDPAIGWADLAEAAYAIQSGAQWFATNLDGSIPRDHGIAPGNGALVRAVEYAVGQRPISAGKPEPQLFHYAAQRAQMLNPLMIGDRLDTDIAGGNRAGFRTALVLTGVHQRADVSNAPAEQRPDYLLENLGELLSGSVEHSGLTATAPRHDDAAPQ